MTRNQHDPFPYPPLSSVPALSAFMVQKTLSTLSSVLSHHGQHCARPEDTTQAIQGCWEFSRFPGTYLQICLYIQEETDVGTLADDKMTSPFSHCFKQSWLHTFCPMGPSLPAATALPRKTRQWS